MLFKQQRSIYFRQGKVSFADISKLESKLSYIEAVIFLSCVIYLSFVILILRGDMTFIRFLRQYYYVTINKYFHFMQATLLNIALHTYRDAFALTDNNHSLLTFVSRTPFPSVSYSRNMTEKKKASPS